MTGEEIVSETKALPPTEQDRLRELILNGASEEIPADFIAAMDDFEHGRFVSMETAMNETPPDA